MRIHRESVCLFANLPAYVAAIGSLSSSPICVVDVSQRKQTAVKLARKQPWISWVAQGMTVCQWLGRSHNMEEPTTAIDTALVSLTFWLANRIWPGLLATDMQPNMHPQTCIDSKLRGWFNLEPCCAEDQMPSLQSIASIAWIASK